MPINLTDEQVEALRHLRRSIDSGSRSRMGTVTVPMSEEVEGKALIVLDHIIRARGAQGDPDQAAMLQAIARLEAQKDGAYEERNKLVCFLTKLFPSWLSRHQPEDDEWGADWRWVVFVLLPTGQVSWHIHDSQLPEFEHLQRDDVAEWDGHTTDEKYARIDAVQPMSSFDCHALYRMVQRRTD